MVLKNFFLLLTLTVSGLAAAGNSDDTILRLPADRKSGGILVENLSFRPEAGRYAALSQRIDLPKYSRYCWFAAEEGRWPAEVNRCLPWTGNNLQGLSRKGLNPIGGKPGKIAQFALFSLEDSRCLALLPTPGKGCVSWLKASENGDLLLESGTLGTAPFIEKAVPRLCWAVSQSPYEACRLAWQQACLCEKLAGETALRTQKTYPEPFRYLGWCSWEQYKKDISIALLLDVVKRIKNSPLPIRWILVDDGFQQQNNLRLKSFDVNPRTFPKGWSPLLAQKDAKIRWMGLWHCYYGLWNGIDPENDFGPAMNKGFARQGPALFPGSSAQAAQAFYNAFMGSVRQAGFDFVKIDVQSSYLKKLIGQPNPAQMNTHASQALEEACAKLKLGLINCMAHGPVNMFHTRHSAVTRCSIDYALGDANQAKSHIYQSYANTLWLGQTVWPDHDMFHSSDPNCGRLMAVSKALSGGPVYLSDAPEDFKAEYIMPLCGSSGKIYRPLAPGVPLPDSIFSNPFDAGQDFRVAAPLPNGCAAVALYNLTRNGNAVSSILEPGDHFQSSALLSPAEKKAWQRPADGLVYFDFYRQQGGQLNKRTEIELSGLSDRLFLLAPMVNGWAVIGRCDKYLAPCTVLPGIRYDRKELALTLEESGPLVVWSAGGKPASSDGTEAETLGNNFWKFAFPATARKRTVTLTR